MLYRPRRHRATLTDWVSVVETCWKTLGKPRSRAAIKRDIQAGAVQINGRKVRHQQTLHIDL